MIIFISDIHLCDESAGPGNIPPLAFTGTFKTLVQMAENAGAQDVTLVYLGDVFDLIRTAEWQKVPVEKRPWGTAPDLDEALRMMELVLEKNAETFAFLRGDLGFPMQVKRVYVPGNHDRMVDMDERMRKLAVENLRLDHDPGKRFQRYFAEPDRHRVFARHGHEFDVFNFEGTAAFESDKWSEPNLADYDQVSIGDVIASEFASALPGAVLGRIAETPANKKDRELLEVRLKQLFDVRPNTSIPEFLAYQIEHFEDCGFGDAIVDGVRDQVRFLRELPAVKAWMKKHDRMSPVDEADILQLVMKLLEWLEYGVARKVAPMLEGLDSRSDNKAARVAREFKRLDDHFGAGKILYFLCGHTHHPDQRLIDTVETPEGQWGRMYLNTGMWRPAQHRGVVRGFTGMKHITTTVVYSPEEKSSESDPQKVFPSFEVWTGALKNE